MVRGEGGVDVPIPTKLFEATTKALLPKFASEEKRLVDEAVVVKRLVVVAEVVVDLTAVKFWRVEELFTLIPKVVVIPLLGKRLMLFAPFVKVKAPAFVNLNRSEPANWNLIKSPASDTGLAPK